MQLVQEKQTHGLEIDLGDAIYPELKNENPLS